MTYTALVLTEDSHNKLVATFQDRLPEGWKVYGHHMTIHMGPAKEEEQPMIGEFATLLIDAIASNDKVMAVRVAQAFTTRIQVESKNPTPHVTLAVNRKVGGKPVMSNQLTEWEPVETVRLRGRIEEAG